PFVAMRPPAGSGWELQAPRGPAAEPHPARVSVRAVRWKSTVARRAQRWWIALGAAPALALAAAAPQPRTATAAPAPCSPARGAQMVGAFTPAFDHADRAGLNRALPAGLGFRWISIEETGRPGIRILARQDAIPTLLRRQRLGERMRLVMLNTD